MIELNLNPDKDHEFDWGCALGCPADHEVVLREARKHRIEGLSLDSEATVDDDVGLDAKLRFRQKTRPRLAVHAFARDEQRARDLLDAAMPLDLGYDLPVTLPPPCQLRPVLDRQ